MKSKDIPVVTGNVDSNGIPLGKEGSAVLIAEKINDTLTYQIESGEFDVTEVSGLFALQSLLTKVSGGLLDPKQEFIFLKSLAEKKTQNPVQRIEQATKVDLRVSISDAIENSSEALERTLAIAKKHNAEVLERLGGNLMLDGNSDLEDRKNSKEELAAENSESSEYKEPYELTDLRTGGDGSVKIQSFRERISDHGKPKG